MDTVKVELTPRFIRIYINDIVHVSILANSLIGIQSYLVGKKCHIDFHLKETMIDCEYHKRDLWCAILTELKNADLI